MPDPIIRINIKRGDYPDQKGLFRGLPIYMKVLSLLENVELASCESMKVTEDMDTEQKKILHSKVKKNKKKI